MNNKDIEFLNTLLGKDVEFIFTSSELKYYDKALSEDDINYYKDYDVFIDYCKYNDNTKVYNVFLKDN